MLWDSVVLSSRCHRTYLRSHQAPPEELSLPLNVHLPGDLSGTNPMCTAASCPSPGGLTTCVIAMPVNTSSNGTGPAGALRADAMVSFATRATPWSVTSCVTKERERKKSGPFAARSQVAKLLLSAGAVMCKGLWFDQ